MENKKILVVTYSRGGNTKKVGEKISRVLGCDTEEIIDTKKRSGILGFIMAGRDALRKKETVIAGVEKNPDQYDLVIVGTPVWAGNISCAIRTYLSESKGKFKNIAFFTTAGSDDGYKSFANMEEVCGKEPIAKLSIRQKDIQNDKINESVEGFINEIRSKVSNI